MADASMIARRGDAMPGDAMRSCGAARAGTMSTIPSCSMDVLDGLDGARRLVMDRVWFGGGGTAGPCDVGKIAT